MKKFLKKLFTNLAATTFSVALIGSVYAAVTVWWTGNLAWTSVDWDLISSSDWNWVVVKINDNVTRLLWLETTTASLWSLASQSSVTDLQVPNNITVDYAASAGSATTSTYAATAGSATSAKKAILPVASDDIATKDYVDVTAAAAASAGGLPILKSTVATYNWNLGGVAWAHAKCQAEFGTNSAFLTQATGYGLGNSGFIDLTTASSWWWIVMPGIQSASHIYYSWYMANDMAQHTCQGWTEPVNGQGDGMERGHTIVMGCYTVKGLTCVTW